MNYNRLLLMGTCESGIHLLTDIIRWYNNLIVEYNLDKGLNGKPDLDLDILRFISSTPPFGKISFAKTTNPRIFSNLQNFKSWKIIYIYRNIFEGFPSYITRCDKEFNQALTRAGDMHNNLDILYQKAKKQTLIIEFNKLFNNPIDVITKILNYIQFPEIDINFLNDELRKCGSFEFIKKNKIRLGTEFNELMDRQQQDQIIEVVREKHNAYKS